MTSAPLADAEARRLAQTEFRRPLVLEAGAGTGKTTTLVARVLAWCLGPGWERAEAAPEREGGRMGTAEEPDPELIAARTLSGVVALTFTEAAAAEMADRVGTELARLAAGEAPPEWLHLEREELPLLASELWRFRARALVSTLDHLTVTTLHAWCLGLLSTFPLEADLHPRLTVDADGRRVDEVVAETVEAALSRAYGAEGDGDRSPGSEAGDGDADVFLELAARGRGPGEIAEALATLVRQGVPAAALEDDPGSPAACHELLRRVMDTGGRLLAPAAKRFEVAQRVGKAQDTVRAVRDFLGHLEEFEAREDEPSPDHFERLAGGLPDKALAQLRGWSRGRFTQSERKALGDVADRVSEASRLLSDLVRHAADLGLLSLAHRALGPLLRTARDELRARGVVTFQDLLVDAARLLTDDGAAHRAVVQRVRRKIDQLLVDEFQDTDALQCALLRAVALEGDVEDRPGLFLVGDPKQSIYGWRNADLAAYEEFVRAVESAGGERHPLLTSFRSPPALLDEVARIVEPVMEEERDLQPPFEPLLPWARLKDAPTFSAGGRHTVEYWISWRREGRDGEGEGMAALPGGPETRNADADGVEAEAVARDLSDLHRRHGVPWPRMVLLFRSSTQLEPYLEALRRAGVPFQVSGDRQYYRRREVIEAAALVRAVLDPGDHLALLTLLRSSMVGVPDVALLPLWRRELPRRVTELAGRPHLDADEPGGTAEQLAELDRLIEEAATEISPELVEQIPGLDRLEGWPEALRAALRQLVAARRSFREDPVDVFVATLRDLFLPEPLEAARYLGAYRLANLERFFRTLAEGLEDGGDAGAVLRLLRRSVAEALEAPESPPPEGAADAVQVLTVHSAKGLEFDHVYFVQLHRGTGGPGGGAAATEVLRQGDRLALRLFGADGPGFAELDQRRRRVEEVEQIRLLYVAVTRAKQRLVLAGNWGRRRGGGRPMVELLAERRERPGEPEELWRRVKEGSADAEPLRDATGALWRFPALDEGKEDETRRLAAESAPTGLPTEAQVVRDAEVLARRRERALARQRRPLSAAASEEAHQELRERLAAAEGRDGDRRVRMAVGSALHALLERLDLERLAAGEVKAELAHRRKGLEADLARRLSEQELPSALKHAEELLDRLAEGPLLERLSELADGVLARELPVLLPPESDSVPLGYVAGAVDLLYEDLATGRPVVVDFKTDAVEAEDEIVARAGAYARQGEVYRRAVQEALDLPQPPRFELWFLHPGRVVGMG